MKINTLTVFISRFRKNSFHQLFDSFMKKVSISIAIALLALIFQTNLTAGELTLYQSGSLPLKSLYLQDSIILDIHLPESYNEASGSVLFPLIILFDSYNELTHAYNLHSIDILTLHGQMPESVIVGVPFTMQNRRYLTSQQVIRGDSLSGIGRMERFLFEELMPLLRDEYDAGGNVLLFGHSRTGFLTSYLMVNRSDEFDVAGSFSGFFESGFEISEMEQFLINFQHKRNFHFYFSAGDTREEQTYYDHYSKLEQWLAQTKTPQNFNWRYIENRNANHMTNYNLSLPAVLVDYFGFYNSILDNWLFGKLESVPTDSVLLTLKKDFEDASGYYGKTIAPNPVHIYSITSHYVNNDDYQTALEVYLWGKEFYPLDYEMDYYIIDILLHTGEVEDALRWVSQTKTRIRNDNSLAPSEKTEMLQTFDGLMEE